MHTPPEKQPQLNTPGFSEQSTSSLSSGSVSMTAPVFQLAASGADLPVQMVSEWQKDNDGNLYYHTQAEAAGRMAALQASGGFDNYRVVSFDQGGSTYWRVEMRNGGGNDNETTGSETSGQNFLNTGGSCNIDGTYTNIDQYGNPYISDTYVPVDNTSTIGYLNPYMTPSYLDLATGGGETTGGETTGGETTTTNTTPTPVTTNTDTPTNDEGSPHNLGLTGSVGEGMTNNADDVAKVRGKLVAYGFLAADATDQASLNDAIGAFQRDVLGFDNPDKQISAGGTTDRALTTYYSAVVTDYSSYETALNDITVNTVAAPANFATTFAGVTINAASTAANVNLDALVALQDRLAQIDSRFLGRDFDNTALRALLGTANGDLNAEQQTLVTQQIAATVTGIQNFQRRREIQFWSTKTRNDDASQYVLTDSATQANYTNGQVADGDASFIYLRDYEYYTISFTNDAGETVTRRRGNFVKSGVTTYTEGIGDVGTVDPESFDIEKFQTAGGIDESRAKALRQASHHEGNFDAVNTYDRAVVSWGFIQFAGGNRSLEYLFARIKHEKPATWQQRFAQYGIDVEYRTNQAGEIIQNTCRVVVHNPDDDTTYRGMDAEYQLQTNVRYSGVLMQAAHDPVCQDMQIAVAVSNYVDTSEAASLYLRMSVLTVDNGENNDPDTYTDISVKQYSNRRYRWISEQAQIEAFKATAAYQTALAEGRVTETQINDMNYGEIMQSEKERAALYGCYLNSPAAALSAFAKGLRDIIIADGLTTEAQIRAIDPVRLLEESEQYGVGSHGTRMRDARLAEDLEG